MQGSVVDYVARQLKLDPSLYTQYDWEGRTIKGHRAQIREHFAFREATVLDTEEMKTWLVAEKLASDQQMKHLKVIVTERFRDLKIEPPTTERLERLIRSACSIYEQQLFAQIMQRLPPTTRTLLDELLTRSEVATQIVPAKRTQQLCHLRIGYGIIAREKDRVISPFPTNLGLTISAAVMVLSVLTSRTVGKARCRISPRSPCP